MSPSKMDDLKNRLEELLEKGFIKPSVSRTLRLCIDYRKFNVVILKNKGLLPKIEYLSDRLKGVKVFFRFDL